MPDETLVQPSNGIHSLKSARDAEIEGINPDTHDVFLTDKNLEAAKAAYPDYDWFVSFSVKDKQGNFANVPYTLTFNKPLAGAVLYYFLNGTAVQLAYTDGPSKGSQARVRAQLSVGDPPIGVR